MQQRDDDGFRMRPDVKFKVARVFDGCQRCLRQFCGTATYGLRRTDQAGHTKVRLCAGCAADAEANPRFVLVGAVHAPIPGQTEAAGAAPKQPPAPAAARPPAAGLTRSSAHSA